METKNHWHLAEFICSEQNFEKYKKQFMLGNIMPDINLFTYLQGHTYKESIGMVRANAKSLIQKKKWNGSSFYHLGVILHYVADYFTFPHNITFSGTLKEHCAYEKKLCTHFYDFLTRKRNRDIQTVSDNNCTDTYIIAYSPNLNTVDTIPTPSLQPLFNIRSLSDLFTFIEKKHHDYLSMMPSFETDCQFIFSLTNIVAYLIPKLHEENHCKNITVQNHEQLHKIYS